MVKSPRFHCRGCGFHPWWRTKIPRAGQRGQKKLKTKTKKKHKIAYQVWLKNCRTYFSLWPMDSISLIMKSTYHMHISCICSSSPCSLKAMVFRLFVGGRGADFQDSKHDQTTLPQCKAISIVIRQHHPALRWALTASSSCCLLAAHHPLRGVRSPSEFLLRLPSCRVAAQSSHSLAETGPWLAVGSTLCCVCFSPLSCTCQEVFTYLLIYIT